MYRLRTCRCECCELPADVPVDPSHPLAEPMCARCRGHHNDAVVRALDHAAMYRLALAEAQDETALVEGERDFYRERAGTTAKNAELLIRTLTSIDDVHHDSRGVCACGHPSCPVRELLVQPAVSRLIGTYDEHQHTLYELRRANPGAWDCEWDYIDVTLAYPPRNRRPVGRHRATG